METDSSQPNLTPPTVDAGFQPSETNSDGSSGGFLF